jgi:uncharacterized membrane protein
MEMYEFMEYLKRFSWNIFHLLSQQTIAAWRIVFLTATGINAVVSVFYVFFAKTDIQPWNYSKWRKQ